MRPRALRSGVCTLLPRHQPLEARIAPERISAEAYKLQRELLSYLTAFPARQGARSRYLLHENGTFALQYVGGPFGFGEYRGRYSWGNGTINFDFDANQPRWRATGTIHVDFLSVKYNVDMSLSDFEDGVYRLAATEALVLPAQHGTNSGP